MKRPLRDIARRKQSDGNSSRNLILETSYSTLSLSLDLTFWTKVDKIPILYCNKREVEFVFLIVTIAICTLHNILQQIQTQRVFSEYLIINIGRVYSLSIKTTRVGLFERWQLLLIVHKFTGQCAKGEKKKSLNASRLQAAYLNCH